MNMIYNEKCKYGEPSLAAPETGDICPTSEFEDLGAIA